MRVVCPFIEWCNHYNESVGEEPSYTALFVHRVVRKKKVSPWGIKGRPRLLFPILFVFSAPNSTMPSFDALPSDVRRVILGISHGRPADERIAALAGSEGDFLLIRRGKKAYRLKLGPPRDHNPKNLQVRGRCKGKPIWRTAREDYYCHCVTARDVARDATWTVLTTRKARFFFDVVRDGKVTKRVSGEYEYRSASMWTAFVARLESLIQ